MFASHLGSPAVSATAPWNEPQSCYWPDRWETSQQSWQGGPAVDAAALGEAVAAAVAPLQAVIESLSGELAAARAANDALRDQLTAAQSEAAELRGRSAANEAALNR